MSQSNTPIVDSEEARMSTSPQPLTTLYADMARLACRLERDRAVLMEALQKFTVSTWSLSSEDVAYSVAHVDAWKDAYAALAKAQEPI